MKLHPRCYPCLINQARRTSELVGLGEDDSRAVVRWAEDFMNEHGERFSAPHITARLYEHIHGTYFKDRDLFDPYSEIKRSTNRAAMEYNGRLIAMIDGSGSPVETAVKIAAAGNIIDFGARRSGDINVAHEIAGIEGLCFGTYHFSELVAALEWGRSLLYLGDNSGEIVFDRALIAAIQRSYPAITITFAVRERPIINDVTMEDALSTGMTDVVRVISSGSVYPGTVLSEAADEFRELFALSDVIISKGQGNYETLGDEAHRGLLFLLRIKCGIVAEKIGSPDGSLVLYKNPV